MAVVGENKVDSLDAVESQCTPGVDNDYDYSQRAQWLRAAVLGANDGLLTTVSLMMGVGAVKDDAKAMLGSGVAGLVAIGEFLLVAARFISSYGVRLEMTAAVTSIALMVFGCVGAALGRVPVGRSCLRVVLGGWLAMTVTFGLMRLFGSRLL